ncbi:hypothetical protein [Actinomadura macra]|uniref:hypothetical protein n=1 Tax=Actinomadura macra TaxID=46164 RepID=UPI0012FC347B|nr:hypothetical protein [Actinomadura macra]
MTEFMEQETSPARWTDLIVVAKKKTPREVNPGALSHVSDFSPMSGFAVNR